MTVLYLMLMPLPYVSQALKLLLDFHHDTDIDNEPKVPIVVEHDRQRSSISRSNKREHLFDDGMLTLRTMQMI